MCGNELLGGGLHSRFSANVSSEAACMWIFLFSQRENEGYLLCVFIQMLSDLNADLKELLALIIVHIITSAKEEYVMASK